MLQAATLERGLMLAAVALAAALILLFLRRSPHVVIALWLVILCFVPVWLGVSIGPFWPLSVIGALTFTVLMLPAPGWRTSAVDICMLVMVALFLAAAVLGLATVDAGFTLIFTWIGGYLFGRVVLLHVDPVWLYRAVSIVFCVVSVLLIVEFLLAWNPFVGLRVDNGLFRTWGSLQERGGVLRAEGAFGHSIAMGASIALIIPLVLANRFALWIRLPMLGLLMTATVVTFSRAGMICAIASIILCLLFSTDDLSVRTRVIIGSVVGLFALAALPYIESVFSAAGDEASGSSAYRGDLFQLLQFVNVLGTSSSMVRLPNGDTYFGAFRSIDSALILFALTYGLLPFLVIAGLFLGGVVLLLRGGANAPLIGVLAQLPALMSVALITQYATVLWFCVGLATTIAVRRRASASPRAISKPTPVEQFHQKSASNDDGTTRTEVSVHGGP